MILVVPACEPRRGGGHLVRCTKIVSELQSSGKDAVLYNNDIPYKNIELIILDRFRTEPEELMRWKEIAPVIGIDEGGTSRDSFDFLIDILPNLEKIKPNISDPSLLPLPSFISQTKQSDRTAADTEETKKIKVLISFGQEDAAGLGFKVANILSDIENNEMEITLLKGTLNCLQPPAPIPQTLMILQSIPNLAEHLREYDLVITHYGITAFEALYTGTPVLLVNPTAYHEKLSKAAGFKTINFSIYHAETVNKKLNKIKTLRLCVSARDKFLKKLSEHCKSLAAKYNLDRAPKSLAALIGSFSPQVHHICPVCSCPAPARSTARFSQRTYRRCPKCGNIYMDRIYPTPIEYERDYFFEQYKKQYGKTYLEDFPNLLALAKRRLQIIKKILPQSPSQRQILDIGCAYGAFLSAAGEEGFFVHGIDPSQDAVRYVQEELHISAEQGFFPGSAVPDLSSLDIITLWFVIEHFNDCNTALKEINTLLKPGGILAFSTPSFSGISGRKNLRSFLFHSPGDHFTIWSVKTCKKALSLFGFKVKMIKSCGHHPQRFPFFGKIAKSPKSPLYWLLTAISRLFFLGDTFEVYAVKKFTR